MENGIVARRVAVKITDGKVERIESNGLLIEGERECMAFLGLESGGETAEQDGDGVPYGPGGPGTEAVPYMEPCPIGREDREEQ